MPPPIAILRAEPDASEMTHAIEQWFLSFVKGYSPSA
jgi:hypothetical protein